VCYNGGVQRRISFTKTAAISLAAFLIVWPAPTAAQTKLPEALSLTDADREILVSDAAGRPIRFDKAPRAFLALGPDAASIAHLLAAFGPGRERLIGMEKAPGSGDPLLERLDPGFGKKYFVAPGWTVAAIAALKADVVLGSGRKLGEPFKALAEAGIPVVLLGIDSPERYERDLAIVGALLAAKERADDIISYYRGLYGRIVIGTAGLTAEVKPRVLLARAALSKGSAVLSLPPLGSMPTGLVWAAGGTPWEDMADKNGVTKPLSMAALAAWNPGLIILSVSAAVDPAAVLAAFRADPGARTLKALKPGLIFTLPSDLEAWDTADPRWILGLNWLAAQIHPGRFPDYVQDTDVMTFFDRLYGLNRSAVAALITPTLRQSVK
jgi:iron complex transport system substrate-binding protein